ncbi:hypothetical protein [Actinacidiphila epipremni]|uniref:Uncharacterized protein n=1 Tax=Actinacidiphila epipremni TaxID=2053013 RepID=A0ABX0ZMG4_9ACTN|nr:hypothetical protein [Actinacidiphila epipremni]NJP43434.1 hypothetical protein [Actinacidiphila epipremni]
MILAEAEIRELLAPAGLCLVESIEGEVDLPQLPPYHSPASAGPEHGRFDSRKDEIADVQAPDMADKINASWYRMATEFGLFDGNREFLLGVSGVRLGGDPDDEPSTLWFRVRLLADWDLVRSEVDLLRSGFATLFTDRFVPEFTMASLDGCMMLNTTVWGSGTVSTIVIRPEPLPL